MMPPWPLNDPFAIAGMILLVAAIPARRKRRNG